MISIAGVMKPTAATSRPRQPARRKPMNIASSVELGPGMRLQAANIRLNASGSSSSAGVQRSLDASMRRGQPARRTRSVRSRPGPGRLRPHFVALWLAASPYSARRSALEAQGEAGIAEDRLEQLDCVSPSFPRSHSQLLRRRTVTRSTTRRPPSLSPHSRWMPRRWPATRSRRRSHRAARAPASPPSTAVHAPWPTAPWGRRWCRCW